MNRLPHCFGLFFFPSYQYVLGACATIMADIQNEHCIIQILTVFTESLFYSGQSQTLISLHGITVLHCCWATITAQKTTHFYSTFPCVATLDTSY